ncbi:hypothetical protein N0V90_000201 [Kalmusia sp. IMI 367209]|nr:hypothetical protein N0V90_000201 [Kalmusia sp. IMI 367209]
MSQRRTIQQKRANWDREHVISKMDEQYGASPPYNSQSASDAPVASGLDFSTSPLELPTAAECVAHLKLLHAFAKLRYDVGNYEGLYGIDLEHFKDAKECIEMFAQERESNPQPQGVHEHPNASAIGTTPSKRDTGVTLVERLREKRWTIFVTKAVDRFEKWWASLHSDSDNFNFALQTNHFDFAAPPERESIQGWTDIGSGMGQHTKNYLPPIDILMVWHSYMLNPRAYLEDCMRMSKHRQWRTTFQWELLYDSIDSNSFDYNPPIASKRTFRKVPLVPWDWQRDMSTKYITCPGCKQGLSVPYTCPPARSTPESMETYLSSDTGYASKGFRETCSQCSLIITHEQLRVGKLIGDISNLRIHKRPLPGTILDSRGVPQMTNKNKNIGTHDAFFPNRVVEKLDKFTPNQLRKNVETLTIVSLKGTFQNILTSKQDIAWANSDQHNPEWLAKESRIAIRRMLSHYWDNSSPFGLDLVGAVVRQANFVQKMAKINWLRSPLLMNTMQRSIVKYHRFVRIIAENPRGMAVPTLDVDLAWHTHQLAPKLYYQYTVSETKRFVNHDDKITETSLNKSFAWTSKIYEKKYGQPYSECACWYCETVREPLRSSLTNRIFGSSQNVKDVLEKQLPRDPTLGPHISAHNAFVGTNSAQERRSELEQLDLRYAKVRKRYQKKKRESDTPMRKNDATIYGPYGFPMYYPVYIPYYSEPTCEDNRFTSSGGGGCVAGTCCEGTSLGNCAGGDGTPGCQASCGGAGNAEGGCGSCGGGDGGGCGGGGD